MDADKGEPSLNTFNQLNLPHFVLGWSRTICSHRHGSCCNMTLLWTDYAERNTYYRRRSMYDQSSKHKRPFPWCCHKQLCTEEATVLIQKQSNVNIIFMAARCRCLLRPCFQSGAPHAKVGPGEPVIIHL